MLRPDIARSIALIVRYENGSRFQRYVAARIGRAVRNCVRASRASPGTFCAKLEFEVVHDHNVIGRVAIAQAIVRLVRCN